jgi:hypothetical protein
MNREGGGFQFTPFGVFPLGADIPVTSEMVPGAIIQGAEPDRLVAAPVAARPPAVLTIDPGKPLTGKQLFAMAKARITEIDRQLRTVPALQSERAQLSALMLAAKPPRKRKDVQ